MNSSDKDAWLDQLLSADDDYLHDNGFTDKVMAQLPAKRRKLVWLEPVILFAATVLSSCVAVT